MSTSLLREALADRSVTHRAAERAREASNVAVARSEATIRRVHEQDRQRVVNHPRDLKK